MVDATAFSYSLLSCDYLVIAMMSLPVSSWPDEVHLKPDRFSAPWRDPENLNQNLSRNMHRCYLLNSEQGQRRRAELIHDCQVIL